MFQFDLKVGFIIITLLIFSDHEKYLVFRWVVKGILNILSLVHGPTVQVFLSTASSINWMSQTACEKWSSEEKDIHIVYLRWSRLCTQLSESVSVSTVLTEVRSDIWSMQVLYWTYKERVYWNTVSETEGLGFIINLKESLLALPDRRIHVSSIKEGIQDILKIPLVGGSRPILQARMGKCQEVDKCNWKDNFCLFSPWIHQNRIMSNSCMWHWVKKIVEFQRFISLGNLKRRCIFLVE